MRRCVKCGRRRPLKKLTEMLDGGVWRCTYWQGRCLEGLVLGLKERGFVAQLEADGVLFRQSGRLLPAAEYQHAGYFEVKTGEAANGHVYTQPRFTPAGIAWAAKRYAMPETTGSE